MPANNGDDPFAFWMTQAFALALGSIGTSKPNPAVGALVLRDGVVVGSGATQPPGGPHAEVVALHNAREAAFGATMVVTLEPCCHHGRTPPCTDAIIAAGISKVVVACRDPYPKVDGKGIETLRKAGVEVVFGVGQDYAHEFYRGYFMHVAHSRPWIDVKIAQSLDGFIGGPQRERVQISGPETSKWVHRLRACVDAILIGGGTAMQDDPLLTVRLAEGNSPQRIVINCQRRLDPNLQLFAPSEVPTRVYSCSPQPQLPSHIKVIGLTSERFEENWISVVDDLRSEGMHRLLIEAGATMASQMLAQPLWDRLLVLTSPKLLGQGLPWSTGLPSNWLEHVQLSRFEPVGNDFLSEFTNVHWNYTSPRNHSSH